uniref:Uncharacterized protein n=1 Tax=Anopheles albimanus TaxID=7167 RepID=A0A182FB64_ANOAL
MDPKCPEFRPNFQSNVSTSAKPLIKPVVRSANKPGFEVRELAMYLKHPMNIQICGPYLEVRRNPRKHYRKPNSTTRPYIYPREFVALKSVLHPNPAAQCSFTKLHYAFA